MPKDHGFLKSPILDARYLSITVENLEYLLKKCVYKKEH